MSEVSLLSLPSYEASNQINTKLISTQDACICCLKKNTQLVNLTSCKHACFLEIFYKYKVKYKSSVICQKCHHFLKKIGLFKQQVEESLKLINKQVQKTSQFTVFQDLILSKTITFSCDVDEEYFVQTYSNVQNDHKYSNLKSDIIIKSESSDFETDVPLLEIREEIKKVKKKKKKTTKSKEVANVLKLKKRLPMYEKYEGKIAIVNLSKTEMYEERQKLAAKESYLKLPYKCEDCITGFDHELTLQDHMEKRHGDKKGGYVCVICKSVLSTESSYKEHTKRHTRRYECQECNKRYSNLYSVIKHYNEHHGTIDTQFTCQDCGFTTGSQRRYRYHRDKHKQKQQCTLCDSTFVTSAGLRVHMFTVHKQSSRVYSCEQCKKVYKTKSGLIAHMSSAHSDCLGAYCAECRTYYKNSNNLAHHLRTHSAHVTDDQRFICDECGAKFLAKCSLQEHIDYVHLKNIKHQCAKCHKVFINGSGLKRHVNYVHKKIRPPRNKICDHCGRGFTTLTILRSHVRTHTGERPLQCPHCPATFAHSAALYTHNKLLHKRQKLK